MIILFYSKLVGSVPLPLSRLLLVFDYLVHFFYDPPSVLIDQVRIFFLMSILIMLNFFYRKIQCFEIKENHMSFQL